MLTDDLKTIGLSENEVRVYLGLMNLGKVRAADVIKQTGLHRNLVYQAFETLSDRHLVTKTTRAGVFHFQTTDPEHLRDQLREQELITARAIEGLKERGRLSDQEITLYEGEDAIRSFSLKSAAGLQPGERIHVLGSGGQLFEQAMGPRALKSYDAQMIKHGSRILMYKRQQISPERQRSFWSSSNVHIRMLPIDAQTTANVVFTDHSVAFLIFEKPYTVIEVRNPHLVAAYKNYFEVLWNQNVRVEHGIEALRDAFTEMIDELKPGEEYYVLGGNLGREYRRMTAFFDEIHRYRITRGVVANILAQSESTADIRDRNRRVGDPEEKISHVKTFNTPFLAPMQINMVNGRAYMVLYKENMPTVIYFEDKEVYNGFRLYFDEIWNRQTETLRGRDGIVSLCEQVLEEGKDLYLIAASGMVLRTHGEYYATFTERRVKKGMRMHILANDDTREQHMERLLPLSHIKYLPKAFASPMVIWIFGDIVAHVIWRQPETIFLIKDAQTAETYRAYYHALEGMAKP